MSENKEHISDQKVAGDGQSCCEGGDCCPSGSGSGGKSWKTLIFVLILIAAGVVLARSFIEKSDADQSQQVFAPIQLDSISDTPSPQNDVVNAEMSIESEIKIETPPVVVETEKQDVPDKAALSLWKADLDSLASLNKVAADSDAVFVLLAASDQLNDQVVTKEIEAAAQKLMANGTKVSAFRLKDSAPEYANLAKQVSVPSVLAMVKGLGMSAVSGDITETKLVQAFVAASRPTSGCCPPGSTACPPQ